MFLDKQLQFSLAQANTTGSVGTNVIDLSQVRSIGSGEDMEVVFTCGSAADQTTGDETYQFDVEFASDAAQTTARRLVGRRIFQAGTPTAPNEDADLLVAGFTFSIPVPSVWANGTAAQQEAQRFLGIRYVGTGTTPIFPAMTAHLQVSSMVDEIKNVASAGYSII